MTAPQLTRLVLKLPWAARSLNHRAAHWAPAAHATKVRRTASWLAAREQLLSLGGLVLDPRRPKRVRFALHGPRLLDPDNATGAIKPYLDGLRDAGVIHDDGPASGHHIELPPAQVLDRAWRGLIITIELLPGGAA